MILSDREIKAAMTRGAIKITPTPNQSSVSASAVDLTLGAELQVWSKRENNGEVITLDPSSKNFNFAHIIKKYVALRNCENGFTLSPGDFVLGWTIEKIQLPHTHRYAARVEGKSSLARLGLGVHITAPTIHSGFGVKLNDAQYEGNPIQLEMWHIGQQDIRLVRGMQICQLIFELVDGTPEKGYQGQFTMQGPGQN